MLLKVFGDGLMGQSDILHVQNYGRPNKVILQYLMSRLQKYELKVSQSKLKTHSDALGCGHSRWSSHGLLSPALQGNALTLKSLTSCFSFGNLLKRHLSATNIKKGQRQLASVEISLDNLRPCKLTNSKRKSWKSRAIILNWINLCCCFRMRLP